MVSRGGRSKGCSNCRKRRVKCDETRPTCIRCKKRGVECDGPKDATWISQNSTFPPSPPEETSLVTSNLPVDLSLAAFQDDICLAYTRKNLLRGGSVEIACEMVQFNNGFIESPSKPGITLLRNAIMSLCVTFFGSQHRQEKIKNRGYSQYGRVLRQLNFHLAQPELQTTNETILSVLTCVLLEIFLPTGPNNHMMHMRGIESILEMRGPPTDADQTTAMIFHGLRLLSIIGGLAMSRPSIYSREEWKRLPCIQKDAAGQLRHRVFMILADATRLRHERDIAISAELTENFPSLIQQTWLLLDQLEEVRADWAIWNEKQLDDNTTELGKEIRIANNVSATAHMLYNATRICLLGVLESLEPSPRYASLRNAAAIKITKCLELKMYEQRQGAPESNTIGFVATKVAWQSLGGFDSPEGRKLAKIVKKAANGLFAVGAWYDRLDPERAVHETWNETSAVPSDALDRLNHSLGPGLNPMLNPGLNPGVTKHAWSQMKETPRVMKMAPYEIIDLGRKGPFFFGAPGPFAV